MDFGKLAETVTNLAGQGAAHQWKDLPLTAGVDSGVWNELINLRLRVDGEYVFWKARGGTQLARAIAGNVLTAYPFSARVGGVLTDYVALHTSMGHVELWNTDTDTLDQIMTGFSTTEKVQFAHRGTFLYAFGYDGGAAQYYNLGDQVASAFLDYDRSYLHQVTFQRSTFEQDNILGLEIGRGIIVFQNTDGGADFKSYQSTIDTLSDDDDGAMATFLDPDGVVRSAPLGGVAEADLADTNLILPHSDDTEMLLGKPTSKESDGSGGVQEYDGYVKPALYRQYVIVDLLNDGSVSLPGKPIQVKVGPEEILRDGVTEIAISVTAASANVARRYLCASRWHGTQTGAFVPSSPSYANSPLFIVKELNTNDLFISDNTPDERLLRPVAELLPVVGGVADLFGPGELKPHSVAAFKGSLMAAGYTLQRPIPRPYTSPSAASNENIFVDIEPTQQLPNNMALAFQFEYTDGKRSQIIETEEYLQEGSATSTTPVPCDQTKASATHTVTQGASADGELDVSYDGVTVRVALTLASHPDPSDVAGAIAQAVGADATIRITASVPSGGDILYTEKRYGEEFNLLPVSVSPVLVAAEGYIDVTANNLAAATTEDHTLTVGVNSTAPVTVADTDTLEQIVDKYVAALNGDATISAGWTASKVDNGDGTWRCLITSDAPGTADNGAAVSVGGAAGVTVAPANASGGSDGPGVSFDDASPAMGGAADPEGTPAKAFIRMKQNYMVSGDSDDYIISLAAGTPSNVDSVPFTITDATTPDLAASAMVAAVNDAASGLAAEWTAYTQQMQIDGEEVTVCVIESKAIGDTSKNGISVNEFRITSGTSEKITWGLSAPGTVEMHETETAGAEQSCLPATGSITISANSLGAGASENHTLSVDGASTAPITIADTDTLSGIADKYIAAIEATVAIDLDWKASKLDNGDGTWSVLLSHRVYGTAGNSKVIAVTGAAAVTVTTANSSGGDNAGQVSSGPAQQVNANKIQIHSLNALVARVFVLGRVVSGTTSFHPIRAIGIDEAEAHGMVVDLPNTQAALDEIEATTHPQPAASDVLETVELQNYVVVGTPYQQFNISAQKDIDDQSRILRAIPLSFDVDKTRMRYRVALLTDQNIQIGYLVEDTSAAGQYFEGDFDVAYNNVAALNRQGLTKIKDLIPVQDKNGLFFLSTGGKLQKMVDTKRFEVLANNPIVDCVFNAPENEYWFVCKNNDIVVYDADHGGFSLMRLGAGKTLFSAAWGHDKLFLGMNGGLYETDVEGLPTDYPAEVAPDAIACAATTTHIGTEEVKSALKELLVAGQGFSVAVDVDVQAGRKETGGAAWAATFSADKNFAGKTAQMYGQNYQLNAHAPMPRIRLSFDAVADGFLSSVRLKTTVTENAGKARE